jgi:hypothetical protein
MKTIVVLSGVKYNSTKQRPHHMVDYFASEGFRVYYLSINGLKREITREKFDKIHSSEIISNFSKQIKENAYEVDKIYSTGSKHIEFFLNKLFIENSNQLTVIVSHPDWMREINNISNNINLIYDCMDDWEEFVNSLNWGWNNSTIYYERKLASIADLVLCSSKRLYLKMLNFNKNTLYIPNGVNNSDYQNNIKEAYPLDMKDIDSPIIFFMGAIAGWVDIELIKFLAEKRPEYNFVFVGEEVKEKLPSKTNVHMLGKKNYKVLNSYLKASDVSIIPFKENNLTAAVTPLKFYEYISAGKPVVSTMLPDLIGVKGVKVADNREDFLFYIDQYISTDSVEITSENKKTSKQFDWSILFEPLKKYIETSSFNFDMSNLIHDSINLYQSYNQNKMIKNELISLYNVGADFEKATEVFDWNEIKEGVEGIDYNQIAYSYLKTGEILKAEKALWNFLSLNKYLEGYIPYLKKLYLEEEHKEKYLTIYIYKFAYRYFDALRFIEEELQNLQLKLGISASLYFEIGEKEIGMQLALEALNSKSYSEIIGIMDVYTIENLIDYFVYIENYEDAEYLSFILMANGHENTSTKILSRIYYSRYSLEV